jgi:heterotetrameric sarcosine oxidase gamma subunit
MHEMHAHAGAAMVEQDGWLLPSHYTSAGEEADRARRSAGMCDVSSTGKLVVYADDMDAALNAAFGLDAAPGVRRTAWADGALLARMARDEVWALTPAGGAAPIHSRLAGDTHAVDVTSGLAGVAIVGPGASSVLAALTELDVSSIGFADMTCAQASVAEIGAALVRRDADLPRIDLYFGREYGEHMWAALLDAGAAPMGYEALRLATGG